jgi:hypothetical protein
MTWNATAGRITFFPTPQGTKLSVAELYAIAFGVEPDAHATNSTSATSSAQGVFKDVMMATCSIQPVRIDLGFLPREQESSAPTLDVPSIEDVGMLRTELGRLIDHLSAALDRIPCTRAAVFVQLTRIVPTVKEGNAAIRESLPKGFELPLVDEDNVVFQMNKVHKSKTSNALKLNFITRWSLDNIKLINLPLVQNAGVETVVVNFVAANIAFDNNTAPGDRVLGSDELTEVLHELLNRMPENNGVSAELGFG